MAIPYVQQRGGDRSHDTWTFLVQILRSSVLQPVHFAVHGGECYSPPFAVGRTTVGAFCSTRGRTRENYSRCLSQYTRENTPARGPFGANSTIRGATFGGFKFVGLHEMILLIVILPWPNNQLNWENYWTSAGPSAIIHLSVKHPFLR